MRFPSNSGTEVEVAVDVEDVEVDDPGPDGVVVEEVAIVEELDISEDVIVEEVDIAEDMVVEDVDSCEDVIVEDVVVEDVRTAVNV